MCFFPIIGVVITIFLLMYRFYHFIEMEVVVPHRHRLGTKVQGWVTASNLQTFIVTHSIHDVVTFRMEMGLHRTWITKMNQTFHFPRKQSNNPSKLKINQLLHQSHRSKNQLQNRKRRLHVLQDQQFVFSYLQLLPSFLQLSSVIISQNKNMKWCSLRVPTSHKSSARTSEFQSRWGLGNDRFRFSTRPHKNKHRPIVNEEDLDENDAIKQPTKEELALPKHVQPIW